jgi:transcriptional regulator
MYQPSHFKEERPEVLRELIAGQPLGALVTFGADGIEANHIPFLYDPEPAPLGTLRAHVARNNPVWREFRQDIEALAIFQGPQLYVTPSWYPRKEQTGKVVPTWNYLVVHAYGPLRAIEDREWLRNFVTRLTDNFERERASPWKVTDAPSDYIEAQLKAIVGIEIPVTRLFGKWKTSQNQLPADREGVVRGLREAGDANSLRMAEWVEDAIAKGKAK